DGRFTALEKSGEGSPREVWMVHSGGFYRVEKTKLFAVEHPLHWFRWEAMVTWLSGFALIMLVYWFGGAMVDPSVRELSTPAAIGIGAAVIFLGWWVYDTAMMSPLARSERGAAAMCFLLVAVLAYALTHLLSGRAAYI